MMDRSHLRRLCLLVMLLGGAGCSRDAPPTGTQLTEAQAVAIAEPVLSRMFGDDFERCRPYRAAYSDGVWTIFGTLPPGTLGGTPEAQVHDSDGVVLKAYHTQ